MLLSKVILILCSLSLALTLSPTLEKNYFFINMNNHLSQELFQTRFGIISHNVQYDKENSISTSQYILVDLPSKDAFPILSTTVSDCEKTTPTFQHLHYHAQTESLVYFCAANTSLLILNQPSFTVQTVIPLNTQVSWPVASLSTDGMNVAILAMDTLINQASSQSSALFRVNMQTKEVSTQILFNKNLASGENVVAYATGKKATFIATNKIQGDSLTTTVYSIIIISNAYQLTPVSTFTTTLSSKIVTKLFCLGNLVLVNNGEGLNFINQQGVVTKTVQVRTKAITGEPKPSLFVPSFTSQADSSFVYVHSDIGSADQYSVLESAIFVKQIGVDGNFQIGDFQIAHSNSTSGDLIFSLDFNRFWSTVTDIKASKVIYRSLRAYSGLMLTETTYAIITGNSNADYNVYIYDLKTDALIATVPIGLNKFYYNKDQQILTFLNTTYSSLSEACAVIHIDIASGKYWEGLKFPGNDDICLKSYVIDARVTENGNSEVIFPFAKSYLIISETYGQLIFNSTAQTAVSLDKLKVNFDDLSADYLVSNLVEGNVNASYYTFNAQSKQFQISSSKIVDAQAQGFGLFTVNSTMSVAIYPNSVTLINQLAEVFHTDVPEEYNLATVFHDSEGKQYVILAEKNIAWSYRTFPGLLQIDGGLMDLPGTRKDTVSALATGLTSFAVYDDISSAFGLVRFYNASSKTKPTLISI